MSGRVKIKSKVVKATLANKDVLDMFHGVLGTSEGAATISITHPKYLRILNHVERFLKLLTVLQESNLMACFPGPREHLGAYIAALRGQLAGSFNAPDLSGYLQPGAEGGATSAEDYAKIPPEVIGRFTEVFNNAKKCSLVNTIVVTCKNLVTHKKALQDQSALSDRFLRGAGMTFCPLPDLPQVNFKQIYIDDRLAAADKEFVLVVLHKLFTIGHDVYEVVSSPDVDVNEFVEVIMSSIGEVKKHIPRCDQAFQKIIESVDLLKGNFNGYYKDYVASNNPTIIMENFVLDVSKNTKSSPAVTAQFRRIITHYRKLASQQSSHPKLQSLFQQVDKNFQELETKSKEADAAEDPAADDLEDGDASDGESPAAPDSPGVANPPGESTSKKARNRRKKAQAKKMVASAPGADPRPQSDASPAARGGDNLADEFDQDEPAGPGAAEGSGSDADDADD